MHTGGFPLGIIGFEAYGLGIRVEGLGFGVEGVPNIRGTISGVPLIRTIVVLGAFWFPLFWETTIRKFLQGSTFRVQVPK